MTMHADTETSVNQELYANTVRFFGKLTGTRIYANALMVQSKKSLPIDISVRYVIGALKRIRTLSAESGKYMSYSAAIERYEEQNSEGGRKYDIASSLARYDMEHHDAGMVAQKMIIDHEAKQEAQDVDAETKLAVKLWVEDFLATITIAKSIRLTAILTGYKAGSMARVDAQYVSNYLAPKGLGAGDFMEIMARYA